MAVIESAKYPGSEQESGGFLFRHLGPRAEELPGMLKVLGVGSLDQLISKTVPQSIRLKSDLTTESALSEHATLLELERVIEQNKLFRSFIGEGFSGTITPAVIKRTIFENPGWYTAYTPYQAEISQGRMEALINFQTMICDLTGLQIANASLLDEGTAVAEAMAMAYRLKGDEKRCKFVLSAHCHPHVIDVVQTRAEPLGIELQIAEPANTALDESYFGAVIAYPHSDGEIADHRAVADKVHAAGALLIVDTDILALTLLTPPGEWGADIVVGNSQRFGVPLGFGGPHAAFMATRDEYKREIPGRLIGVSKDSQGAPAYRLTLQTREQHIRRDRATSNICTAQVLLAVMASMYAVYHGPRGLRAIAERVSSAASKLAATLKREGLQVRHAQFFDTVRVDLTAGDLRLVRERAEQKQINLRFFTDGVGAALDETTSNSDLSDLVYVLVGREGVDPSVSADALGIPRQLLRTSSYLTHSVFNSYHSESEMLRYIKRLESKDLSLTTSMIPLGSCTMKLNAATEMYPVSWPKIAGLHPFVPLEQSRGYQEFFKRLESMLRAVTGFAGVSLQPNAGSQGEYAGLLVIRAYQKHRGEGQRNVCLIPTSAHGTNPASAAMAGFDCVTVACDASGNVDLADLKKKAVDHSKNLACLMVTYPSTHGVFEEAIQEICKIIHDQGGQVYMDGANMNAQVGLCSPSQCGADVVHINLHKTFCIPHGGGGPGMGPICVAEHLVPFLPRHRYAPVGGELGIGPVCSAPWGSASILPISWAYAQMMGGDGLALATKVAILNANYVAKRLEPHFPVLYKGMSGFVAHECILDMRQFKRTAGVDEIDVAKRLMDYGFHAPTVSFPVAGTLMIEPTESESLAELDRFCEAMISIREEIRQVEVGQADKQINVLKNAPHTAQMVTSSEWNFPYSREQAAYPAPWLRQHKFWPAVGRVDNTYGDRHVFCSCIS